MCFLAEVRHIYMKYYCQNLNLNLVKSLDLTTNKLQREAMMWQDKKTLGRTLRNISTERIGKRSGNLKGTKEKTKK